MSAEIWQSSAAIFVCGLLITIFIVEYSSWFVRRSDEYLDRKNREKYGRE